MSEGRRLAFKKPSAGPDAGAVRRLAFLWTELVPVVRGYFEELYEAMPDKVSTVLAGAVLPRGGEHLTLASWAETALDEHGRLDLSGLTISLGDVKVEPANPGSGAAFAVVWSVYSEAGFPARQDRVQLFDANGKQVATDKMIAQPLVAPGGIVDVRADFEGLPNGTYQATVVANVEGSEGTAINDHGFQSAGGASFIVGATREAQFAEDLPKFTEAYKLIGAVANTNADLEINEEGYPARFGLASSHLERLAEAADLLASMDVLADGFKQALGNAASWLRGYSYAVPEEEWTTWRGQLLGLLQSPNPEQAGTFARQFIEILEEHSDVRLFQ
jgi:hypothetical protein